MFAEGGPAALKAWLAQIKRTGAGGHGRRTDSNSARLQLMAEDARGAQRHAQPCANAVLPLIGGAMSSTAARSATNIRRRCYRARIELLGRRRPRAAR